MPHEESEDTDSDSRKIRDGRFKRDRSKSEDNLTEVEREKSEFDDSSSISNHDGRRGKKKQKKRKYSSSSSSTTTDSEEESDHDTRKYKKTRRKKKSRKISSSSSSSTTTDSEEEAERRRKRKWKKNCKKKLSKRFLRKIDLKKVKYIKKNLDKQIEMKESEIKEVKSKLKENETRNKKSNKSKEKGNCFRKDVKVKIREEEVEPVETYEAVDAPGSRKLPELCPNPMCNDKNCSYYHQFCAHPRFCKIIKCPERHHVCRFFIRGGCYKGNSCKFYHAPSNEAKPQRKKKIPMDIFRSIQPKKADIVEVETTAKIIEKTATDKLEPAAKTIEKINPDRINQEKIAKMTKTQKSINLEIIKMKNYFRKLINNGAQTQVVIKQELLDNVVTVDMEDNVNTVTVDMEDQEQSHFEGVQVEAVDDDLIALDDINKGELLNFEPI